MCHGRESNPASLGDQVTHARKMGKSRTRARVGKSVACRRDRRGRKTRRASRMAAQTFKIIQLQSDEKDVRPCVFRCERLHGCCKSQPTGGLPRTSDTDKYLRWWVFVADFACQQPNAVLLAPVMTSGLLSLISVIFQPLPLSPRHRAKRLFCC